MSKIASCFRGISLFAFLLSVLTTETAFAQTPFSELGFNTQTTYRVILNDNSELIGQYIDKTNEVLILKTSSLPRIEVPFSSIKDIEEVNAKNIKADGSYWFPNPNPTRYLFAPSAIPLKKGEGYYQNNYLVLNSVNIGVLDFLSIGGGIELISTFSTETTPLFFITPKAGAQVSDNLYLGGGLLFINAEETSLGTTYGLATIGDHDKNLTGGIGFGFFEGEFSSRPMFTLSGITRVKRRISLVSENWLVPIDDDNSYYGFISYGVRFFGDKLAVDLAFINNSDIAEAILIGVPYVDFVVNF